jgi:hypothetical protein
MSVSRGRDNFQTTIIRRLAMRASYICSNPKCRTLTLGPSEADLENIISVGVAAHITAAAPGGPRYDSTLTPAQRSSIENGIFLCPTCASTIDKNGGRDFPVELLRKWKSEHEEWVRGNLNKSVNSLVKSRAPLLEVCFDDGSTRLEVQKIRSSKKGKDEKRGLSDLIVRLDLQITNRGDGPASDIHVFLELAGPYQIYDAAALRRRWETYPHNFFDNPGIFLEQLAGKKRMPLAQRVASDLIDEFGFAAFELGIAADRKKPQNVTSQDARPKVEGTRVIFHIKRLKQNLAQTLESLYIVFHSWEEVSPFSIPFRVNAEDFSADVEGTLEVSVSKGREAAKKSKASAMK